MKHLLAGLLVALITSCSSPSYHEVAWENAHRDPRSSVLHHFNVHWPQDLAILGAVCADLRGEHSPLERVGRWYVTATEGSFPYVPQPAFTLDDFVLVVDHYIEHVGIEWFCPGERL